MKGIFEYWQSPPPTLLLYTGGMNLIPWYVSLIRLVVPFLILHWPLFGILASSLADISDWKFIGVSSNQENGTYQNWDKAMDLYYWFFILWIISSWKDVWARNVAWTLFGYRLLGTILFWITGWGPILFFFPNIFENFVILCLVLFRLTKTKKLRLTFSQKFSMLAIVAVPKFIHEYFQHFLGRQPWEIYDVGSWLRLSGAAQEYTNCFFWGGIIYVVPVLGFLVYILPSLKQLSK